MTNGERKLCEWQYKKTGSFYTALFELMCKADLINLDHLSKGFPDEASAVLRYKNEDGYWDRLDAEFKK